MFGIAVALQVGNGGGSCKALVLIDSRSDAGVDCGVAAH